jgi:hypothetical protein
MSMDPSVAAALERAIADDPRNPALRLRARRFRRKHERLGVPSGRRSWRPPVT